MELVQINCSVCGGSVTFSEDKETAICDFCNSTLHFKHEVQNACTENKADIGALGQRIVDLIQGRKFIQAEALIKEGLKSYPYAGVLHLYMLMCEYSVSNPADLASCGKNITQSSNYKKCLRYLFDDEKQYVISLAVANSKNGYKESTSLYDGITANGFSEGTGSFESDVDEDEEEDDEVTDKTQGTIMDYAEAIRAEAGNEAHTLDERLANIRKMAIDHGDPDVAPFMLQYGLDMNYVMGMDKDNILISIVDASVATSALRIWVEKAKENSSYYEANQQLVEKVALVVELCRHVEDLNMFRWVLDGDSEWELNEKIEHLHQIQKECCEYIATVAVSDTEYELDLLDLDPVEYCEKQIAIVDKNFSSFNASIKKYISPSPTRWLRTFDFDILELETSVLQENRLLTLENADLEYKLGGLGIFDFGGKNELKKKIKDNYAKIDSNDAKLDIALWEYKTAFYRCAIYNLAGEKEAYEAVKAEFDATPFTAFGRRKDLNDKYKALKDLYDRKVKGYDDEIKKLEKLISEAQKRIIQ